jgi:hypothetical protein
MVKLNNDILLNIYSFVGPKTIYLSKDFNKYLKCLKNEFQKEPLKLSYQLVELKSKFFNNTIGRPSIKVGIYTDLEIKGNVYLGNYNKIKKKFYFSKQIEDQLIPVSTMKLSNSNSYYGTVVYWELNSLLPIDNDTRINKYQLIYNKYSF